MAAAQVSVLKVAKNVVVSLFGHLATHNSVLFHNMGQMERSVGYNNMDGRINIGLPAWSVQAKHYRHAGPQ